MPKLDRTGPQGQGPRTGRGMGNCSGTGGSGRGFGRGMGRGFGRSCFNCPFWINQQVSNDDRKKILIEEKEIIEKEIADLENDK